MSFKVLAGCFSYLWMVYFFPSLCEAQLMNLEFVTVVWLLVYRQSGVPQTIGG